MATQPNADDDEYVHNLGRILRTLAKEARERGGPVAEIIGQGLVSWQGTLGIGLVPFLAKKAGSGECWIFVRKGERWSLTRSIADAMQIITGGVAKRPYRADERELNSSKSIMTRVLGGKTAWAAEMARRWRQAVVSSRIDKDRGRRSRPGTAGPPHAGPETHPDHVATVKPEPEPAAQLRSTRLAGAPGQRALLAQASPSMPPAPGAEGAGNAAAPSAATFPMSPEAASQWYTATAAVFNEAAAAVSQRSGQALRAMDIRGWTEFEANHTELYVLSKELAAAKACLDVVERGEKRWTAQEPPAPAWHRVKANAVGAVIQAGDLEASCMLYAVNDPATTPSTAAQVAQGFNTAVARGSELVTAAAAEAARLHVDIPPRPEGLAEWASAAVVELERRGSPGAVLGPHVPCDKRDYCCLPAGHRGHCRKPRPEDKEAAAGPVMGKRRTALAAAAAAAVPPAPGDYPTFADPEDEYIDVEYEYGTAQMAPGVRTNAAGEPLCNRNSYCVKLVGHMGRCKVRGPGEADDEDMGQDDRPEARREAGLAPGGANGASTAPAVVDEPLPPGVEKCTRHKHCVKEQGHMGRCRIRAPPRRPPGAAARERALAKAAAGGGAPRGEGGDAGVIIDEDVEFEPCPKDPDCVNWAGHRGRCKIRRNLGAEAGEEGTPAKRSRPAAPDLDLGHLALLAEMAAMPSPGFGPPGAAGAGAVAAPRSPGPKGLGGALPADLLYRSPRKATGEASQLQQQGDARAAASAAAKVAAVAGAEKAAAVAREDAAGTSPAHLDVAAVLAAAAAVPEDLEEAEATAAAAVAAPGAQPVVEPAAPEPTANGTEGMKPDQPAVALVDEGGADAPATAAATAAAPEPAAAAAPEAPVAASPSLGYLATDAPLEKKAEGGEAEAPAAAEAAAPAEQAAQNGSAAAAAADNGNASGGFRF